MLPSTQAKLAVLVMCSAWVVLAVQSLKKDARIDELKLEYKIATDACRREKGFSWLKK